MQWVLGEQLAVGVFVGGGDVDVVLLTEDKVHLAGAQQFRRRLHIALLDLHLQVRVRASSVSAAGMIDDITVWKLVTRIVPRTNEVDARTRDSASSESASIRPAYSAKISPCSVSRIRRPTFS